MLDGPDRRRSRWNPRVIAAIAAAVALALAYYFAVHYVHTHVKVRREVMMIYPPMTFVFLVFMLPFIMFASYSNDFKDNVNPLYPPHYWFVFRKTYRALLANNMKVSSKDL